MSCEPFCGNPFDRVRVTHLLQGGARIMWDLTPSFSDRGPYRFQLEVGMTAAQDADDWEPVGMEVVDGDYAIDDAQRLYGKDLWTHYRVRLITTDGEYVSEPVLLLGVLSRREWLLATEIIRREQLRMRMSNTPAAEGFLLKRKIAGEHCSCRDFQLADVNEPNCDDCHGTGFVGGYYAPISCVYADFAQYTRETLSSGDRATINDIVVPARMLAEPRIDYEDVWVNKTTDERWFARQVQSVADVRGVPVIVNVQLRLIPFSSSIYTITIPGQED